MNPKAERVEFSTVESPDAIWSCCTLISGQKGLIHPPRASGCARQAHHFQQMTQLRLRSDLSPLQLKQPTTKTESSFWDTSLQTHVSFSENWRECHPSIIFPTWEVSRSPGQSHFGKERMAMVGVRRVNVAPCTIGNLHAKSREKFEVQLQSAINWTQWHMTRPFCHQWPGLVNILHGGLHSRKIQI